MRSDYETAIRELGDALDRLDRDHSSAAAFASFLLDLTTTLFEVEACQSALEAVLADLAFEREPIDLETLAEECTNALYEMRISLDDLLKPTANVDLALLRDKLAEDIHIGGSERTVDSLFPTIFDLEAGREPKFMHHKDLTAISTTVKSITDKVKHLDLSKLSAGAALVRDAEALSAKIDATVPQIEFAEHFYLASNLPAVAKNLRAYHDELRGMRRGTLLTPANPPVQVTRIRGAAERLQLLEGLRRLVGHVTSRMKRGRVRQHILRRLRVYLEHFARDQLLSALAAERDRATRENGKAQLEALVQSEIDKFIFMEGLFPITHMEAASGKIDTFIADRAELFRESVERQHVPLLLELKQQLVLSDSPVSPSDLRRAIDGALGQAHEYSAHVRAKLRWADHDVAVIVVYDGSVRYKSGRDDVELIYLGGATPSSGMGNLDAE